MGMIDDLYRRWVFANIFVSVDSSLYFRDYMIHINFWKFWILSLQLKLFRHGKKIWLTEFAMSGTNNADKVDLNGLLPIFWWWHTRLHDKYIQVLEFMQDILPMLETHEGVYKYSWFMNRLEYFKQRKQHKCVFKYSWFMKQVLKEYFSISINFQVCGYQWPWLSIWGR